MTPKSNLSETDIRSKFIVKNRERAEQVEKKIIGKEQPKFNIQDTKSKK